MCGFVSDETDGQGLPGVNVVVENAAGEQRGVATDINGLYARRSNGAVSRAEVTVPRS